MRNAAKDGKANPMVSVKSKQKRKATASAAEIYEEAMGDKGGKKRKGKKH